MYRSETVFQYVLFLLRVPKSTQHVFKLSHDRIYTYNLEMY
jgi:hypothetical protein